MKRVPLKSWLAGGYTSQGSRAMIGILTDHSDQIAITILDAPNKT